MRVLLTVGIVLIILFIVSFSLQNASEVPITYYDAFRITMPAYMLMFIAFLVGVIFTGIMGFTERITLIKTIRESNKTIRELKRELRARKAFADGEEKTEKLEDYNL